MHIFKIWDHLSTANRWIVMQPTYVSLGLFTCQRVNSVTDVLLWFCISAQLMKQYVNISEQNLPTSNASGATSMVNPIFMYWKKLSTNVSRLQDCCSKYHCIFKWSL